MAPADAFLLGTFQKHIEDMRSLSLCKICIKPFYEPFILSCGHTYCYSCLASWFSGPHTRHSSKNCPDCRAPVTIQPSPNYLLRDLVHMFISRTELLPEDETVQEHTEAKEQESRLLAADRAGQGLFKGVFDRHSHNLPNRSNVLTRPLDRGAPIRDAEDGVSRCPRCVWELEYGACPQCGWNMDFASDSGTSASSPETQSLADLPPEDGSEAWARGLGRMEEDRTFYDGISDDGGDITEGYSESTEGRGSPSDNDASEDDDEEMEGFIDDDDLPNEVDDDDRSVNTVTIISARSPFDSDDGEGDISDHEIGQPPSQRFYGVTMEESGCSDDSDLSDEKTNTQTTTYEDDPDDMASEPATNYDSDDDSGQENPPPPPAVARSNRRRRVVDSDDDDEDEGEEQEDQVAGREEGREEGREDHDDGPEESDDTTSRPPQNSAFRRQKLQSQRARRSNNQPHHQSRRESPYEDFPTLAQQPGRGYGREHRASATGFHPARRGRPQSMRVY